MFLVSTKSWLCLLRLEVCNVNAVADSHVRMQDECNSTVKEKANFPVPVPRGPPAPSYPCGSFHRSLQTSTRTPSDRSSVAKQNHPLHGVLGMLSGKGSSCGWAMEAPQWAKLCHNRMSWEGAGGSAFLPGTETVLQGYSELGMLSVDTDLGNPSASHGVSGTQHLRLNTPHKLII